MKSDWVKERHRRIRRVKKWLKYLPRRSNIHRYPVLKWFGEAAKKRAYLWSFRSREMISAIFLGTVVSLMPLVGVQMLLVSLLAIFLVRANLPVLVALQWISNPITLIPIYYADYKIGAALLELIGFDLEMNQSLFLAVFENWKWEWKFFLDLIDTFSTDDLVWLVSMTLLGGLALGSFAGLIGVTIYKYLAMKTKAHYLSEKQSLTSEGEGTEEA